MEDEDDLLAASDRGRPRPSASRLGTEVVRGEGGHTRVDPGERGE